MHAVLESCCVNHEVFLIYLRPNFAFCLSIAIGAVLTLEFVPSASRQSIRYERMMLICTTLRRCTTFARVVSQVEKICVRNLE